MPLTTEQKKKYPQNWNYLSAFIREVRDRNKCLHCGRENKTLHEKKGYRIVLTVAHLDHDESNNDFSNLASLCQSCHLNHDRADNLFRRMKNKILKLKPKQI